ncbi:MAG: HIT domain-containing protein, partial [Burkholderiaceae bacterium]
MDCDPDPDRGCALCAADGGALVARAQAWRVVLAGDPDYPAFTRVIWNAHVAEMSDLGRADRDELMRVVFAVEEAQRASLCPDKVNLASFGNVVAHLHWHVVPRWCD